MADAHMVTHKQIVHPEDHIEVTNLNAVFDDAMRRVDDTESNAHALADAIAEQEAQTRPHQERWENRNRSQNKQTKFAHRMATVRGNSCIWPRRNDRLVNRSRF